MGYAPMRGGSGILVEAIEFRYLEEGPTMLNVVYLAERNAKTFEGQERMVSGLKATTFSILYIRIAAHQTFYITIS